MRTKLIIAVLGVGCAWGQGLQPQIKGLDRVGAGGAGNPNATTAGSAAGSANLPMYSAGADRTVQYGTRTGNTLRTFTCSAAALTAGKQVTVDANGNCITSIYDVGASGGGGGANPFQATVSTTPDTLEIQATADFNIQCGREVHTIATGEKVTFDTPTGTDDFVVFFNCATTAWTLSSNTLSGVGTANTTSQNVAVITDLATGDKITQCAIPYFTGSATSNNFDTTVNDVWAGNQAPHCLLGADGVTITQSDDHTLTIEAASGVGGGGAGTGYTITPSAVTRAALQTAIDSVPSTGGTVWVPRGTYAFSTTQVTVAVSQNKTHILCEPGAIFTYTGTVAAFQVGGDLANTEYFRMEGCEIDLSGNTNATAMGLKLIRSFWGNVKNVVIRSTNGEANGTKTALMISGGDGCSGAPGCGSPSQAGFSAYNIVENVAIIGSWLKGIHFASEITGGPSSRDRSNRNTVLGGSIYTSAVSKTGTIGIAIEHGDTNHVLNTDLDSLETGVKVDGHNNHITAKCEGPTIVTWCVDVTANSQGTFVVGVNAATGKFRDNGFETQYIMASQNGVNISRMNNLAALYSFTLQPMNGNPSAGTGAALTNGMLWNDFNTVTTKGYDNGTTKTLVFNACEIIKSGVGATTQATSSTSLADITLPALTVGEHLEVTMIYLHGTPRTNTQNIAVGFDAVANIITQTGITNTRTWNSYNLNFYYTGTTTTYGANIASTNDGGGAVAPSFGTNPDVTSNLSVAGKVLKLKGHLSAVDTTENLVLASYSVKRCRNVP